MAVDAREVAHDFHIAEYTWWAGGDVRRARMRAVISVVRIVVWLPQPTDELIEEKATTQTELILSRLHTAIFRVEEIDDTLRGRVGWRGERERMSGSGGERERTEVSGRG